jgi:hypothetical protein
MEEMPSTHANSKKITNMLGVIVLEKLAFIIQGVTRFYGVTLKLVAPA